MQIEWSERGGWKWIGVVCFGAEGRSTGLDAGGGRSMVVLGDVGDGQEGTGSAARRKAA
jgi:hypothetical protein